MTPTKIDVDYLQSIADQIKKGTWKKKKTVKNLDFFHQYGGGVIAPNRERRIQCRTEDRNLDFIERQVNKVNNGGSTDNISDLTCVEYEDDLDKLLNGNHGVEINALLGIEDATANMVSWKDDLGSSDFNAIRLGNIMNIVEKESQATQNDDIKRELFTLMDERANQGLDPIPTDEQREEFLNLYPQINGQRALGQWISNHDEVGSNNAPKISYTPAQLRQAEALFRTLSSYSEHAILEARTLASWKQTAVEQIFIQMMQEQKKKALVIIYCSTVKQAEFIDNSNIQDNIRSFYDDLQDYYQIGGENIQIDVEYLRHR